MPQRISYITLFLTFCLLIAGGLVHSTGSGLACPDWPLCFGQFFPEMTGGVEFEHSHRLIAGLVALFTFYLFVSIWRKHQNRTLRFLSLSAFILVLIQALLGGLTVIFRLPTIISTSHLATAMVFFSLLIFLSIRLHPFDAEDHQIKTLGTLKSLILLRRWLWLIGILTYLQIVLGALVRHTGAGSVCPTIPFCEGALWPRSAHPSIQLHMAHRWGAVLISLLIFWLSYQILPLSRLLVSQSQRGIQRTGKIFRGVAFFLPLLILLQIFFGFYSVVTDLKLFPVTTHLAIGALILGSLITLLGFTQRIRSANPVSISFPSFFRDYLSLTKARLSILVLIVTIISFYLAPRTHPLPSSLFWFTLLGIYLLVAGGSFLNAYFERQTDAKMPRTKDRPLPQGRLNEKFVRRMGIFFALLGVPILTLLVNPITGFLGASAFICYSLLYTPLKKKTGLAALIGAIPGALPPLIGWTAVTGKVDAIGATLFFILFFWQMPHFFAIALWRQEEYSQAGLQVMPVSEGEQVTKRLMIRYSALLIPITLFLVPLGLGGWIYFFVALVLGAIFFLWTCYGLKPEHGKQWARSLFIYSLFYLPLLFITLFLDTRF